MIYKTSLHHNEVPEISEYRIQKKTKKKNKHKHDSKKKQKNKKKKNTQTNVLSFRKKSIEKSHPYTQF